MVRFEKDIQNKKKNSKKIHQKCYNITKLMNILNKLLLYSKLCEKNIFINSSNGLNKIINICINK